MDASINKIILFTDPHTVAALNAADEPVKKVMRDSGLGLVLSGWSDQTRISSLIRRLREIAEKYGKDRYAAKVAVFDLHRFVCRGLMAEIDPNPFSTPLPPATEEFDLATAIGFSAPPRKAARPMAPEHLQAARRRDLG